MTTKKCKWCGNTFTPPPNKSGNPMKYCSQKCRVKAYDTMRKHARDKYRKRHKKQNLKKCAWCGKQFVSTHGSLYCCTTHRKYAKQEQSRMSSIKYALKELSEKQKYFKFLGNSNLREHRKEEFDDESRLIKAEIRRLKI